MRTTYSNQKHPRSAREIVMDVIENWKFYQLFSSHQKGKFYQGDIGEPIRRLAPHDQEILKGLKSDDLQNIRWPDEDYLLERKDGTKVFRLPHIKS